MNWKNIFKLENERQERVESATETDRNNDFTHGVFSKEVRVYRRDSQMELTSAVEHKYFSDIYRQFIYRDTTLIFVTYRFFSRDATGLISLFLRAVASAIYASAMACAVPHFIPQHC